MLFINNLCANQVLISKKKNTHTHILSVIDCCIFVMQIITIKNSECKLQLFDKFPEILIQLN